MPVDLFSVGNSSLHTAKKSLSTTSHNISNANNEDFSRQRVTTETNNPVAEGNYVLGNGVRIREIKRVHDDLVEKKLNNTQSNSSYHNERTSQLGRVEEIFNEINNEGMNKVLNRFFNSFRELSNRPDDEVVRSMVRDNAKMVVSDFKRINQEITGAKNSIDRKLEANIDIVNDHAKKIAELNVEIVRLENMSGETGDLRDKRDASIREIAKHFQIHAYPDNRGHYNVNIVGGGTIVSGSTVSELEARKIPSTDSRTRKDEGHVELFFKGRNSTPVSQFLKNGEVKALMETRNVEIDVLREQMDSLAYNLAKSTNAIHQKGFASKEVFFDEQGNPITDGTNEPVTGINFFKEPNVVDSASEFLELSDDIEKDLRNISTGLAPNSPGDNRVAIAVSKLQHEKVLGDRNLTFEESYLEAVGTIGLKTAKSKIDTEQADGILAQAKSVKARTSGVSLDEETANLVKYQHQYDASARVIKVADEMFDSVLGMMR